MLIKRFIISSILCLAGLSLHAFQLELKNGDGRYGLVDKSSNEIILNKDFEKIGWENDQISINGIIRARKNQKWALYDEKGTLLTAHEFTTLVPHNATSFIAGKRASNSILQQFGLIDIKGKTIIPFEFLRLASAGNSLIATYRENDQLTQALYDAKGKSIIRGKHPRINPLNDGFFAVQNKEGLYALHKGDGQALSPYEFQEINMM